MKIVQINAFSNGSTGSIMMNIHNELINQGYDSYVVWGRGRKSKNESEIYMNDKVGVYLHALLSRITGKVGFYSKRSTKKLLKKLDIIKPDIIHLHNIHGYYINIELLFDYIKENNIKIIWTLHDCWSFTGHCAYFDYVDCSKWKSECKNCPQLNTYPKSLLDNSKWCYYAKKQIFDNIKDLTIITPSEWLAKLVKNSFLKKYDVKVINNGIDLEVFKPIHSDFRKINNLNDKKIILGVANVWDRRKGLKDFLELSNLVGNDYKIILVGLSQKQIKKIPKNIIGLSRTSTQKDLVELYSTADVFFNPTYEDNFPTVNLEAIACNTPVVTYDTGGSKETIASFGKIIKYCDLINDYEEALFKGLNNIKKDNTNPNISKNFMCMKYIDCYNNGRKINEKKEDN